MAQGTNTQATPAPNEVRVVKIGQMSNLNYFILLERVKSNAYFGDLLQKGFLQTKNAPNIAEGDTVPASALNGLNIQWQQ